jgi:hypothetical protein
LRDQPGAFIEASSKFAIVGASKSNERHVISVAEFTKMNSSEREALFATGRPIYRRGDTIAVDENAFVVTCSP